MFNTLAKLKDFLVFLAILSTLGALPMYSCNAHRNIEVKKYCSDSLSDALQLICGGKFYSLTSKFPHSMGGSSAPRIYHESALLSKLIPDDFFQPLSANGSTHECCRRPCGYLELKMYCANE